MRGLFQDCTNRIGAMKLMQGFLLAYLIPLTFH